MMDIQIVRNWQCREDDETGGAIRQFPSGRSYYVEDHVGLLAIAEGAAKPLTGLTEQQTLELEVIKASLAGDDAKVAELLAAADGGEGQGQDGGTGVVS